VTDRSQTRAPLRDTAGLRLLVAGIGVLLLTAWFLTLFGLLASGEGGWGHLLWWGTPVVFLGVALCWFGGRRRAN
jgi:hypothetical protein